jgi:pimeloyl-ACP methyl ester carboxylesterase
MSEKHFIAAGAHRVCYVEGGRGDDAVFLHGWIASHQLYRRVFPELGAMFHYWALDLVGFGDSDKPDPRTCAYDAPFYAESLRAFLDAVDLRHPITLVAQSMGGMVAAEFAIRFPHRVKRLVLVDSAGIEVPPPALGRLLQAPILGRALYMAVGGSRKALKDFLLNDVWHNKAVYDDAVIDDMLRVQRQPGGKAAAYAAMTRMVSPRAFRAFQSRFDEIAVPTRILWGERDSLFPLATCGRAIERKIRGSRLAVVKDSGHEPPVERPAAFLAALAEAVQ